MNAVHVIGVISEYGPRLTYTPEGKPQATLTVVVEEPGKDGATYKTFVPILIVGAQAEEWAATLEAGERIALSGKLAYRAGKTKDAGRLVVACYGVERLTATPAPEASLHDT
jgi:single-stranded DNA-binding protein